MRAMLWLTLVFGGLASLAVLQDEAQVARDLKKLAGVWKVEATGGHGKVLTPAANRGQAEDPPWNDMTFTIDGERLATKFELVVLPNAKPDHFAVCQHPKDYRLGIRDAKGAAPAEMDFVIGKDHTIVLKGIYELDGDKLKICVVNWMACDHTDERESVKLADSKPRPTDFKTKAGGDHVSYVLKRAKG